MNLIYDFLFIIGMLFTGIYIYVLLRSKNLNLSKYILIALFSIIILVLLESYAYIHELVWLKYICFAIVHGTKLLIGPLLIAYIQSLFLEDKTVIKKQRFMLLPYFCFALLVSLPYAIARLSGNYFQGHIYLIENYSQYFRIGLDILLLLFLYRAFQQFYKYKNILKCNYSVIEENNFIWVRYLLLSVTIVMSLDLVIALSQVLFGAFPMRSQNIIMSIVALCMVIGAYFGINQSKVLIPYFLLEGEMTTSETKPREKQPEDLKELQTLKTTLDKVMAQEQPYLDEELTLSKLASYVKITDKKLSQLLNQHLETSFYSYVNAYRLEAFKDRLQSETYKDYTIEGIAFECGFKSKASFYRLFKKETGQSPSEYKKSLK